MDGQVPPEWLRHTLATLAYRAEKVLRDTPADFGEFRASPQSRSALGIVAHIGDLMEWAVRMTHGDRRWVPVVPGSWTEAVDRVFASMAALDAALASAGPGTLAHEQIFQAPIADALTHVGQLAMMRGMASAPVRPESFARAHIQVGRVGREQDAQRAEFDGDASPVPSAPADPTGDGRR